MYKSVLLLLLFVASCQPESEDLSASELQVVDSLYSKQIEILRPQLDSICTHQEDSLVRLAVDSLLKVRKKEMEQILNR